MERKVLLGVEHFEQSRGRVAAKIHAQLIDFVEHDERVHRSRFLHHLNYLARQGADVRAPMPSYFGFVSHAAKAQPHKLATGRFCDGTPQACLAYSGWAYETEY